MYLERVVREHGQPAAGADERGGGVEERVELLHVALIRDRILLCRLEHRELGHVLRLERFELRLVDLPAEAFTQHLGGGGIAHAVSSCACRCEPVSE